MILNPRPDINAVLEANLNPSQRAAAQDPAREVLTLACAGSGKSQTLAYRIAWLMSLGVKPEAIVAFTFTDKAAESMKRRVAQALRNAGMNEAHVGAMYIGTIHAYCQHVLSQMDARYRQYDVLDENRLKLYLISRYTRLGLQALRRSRGVRYFETIRQVADAWKTVNDELIDVAAVGEHDEHLGAVLGRLNEALAVDQYIDFSLMIRLVVDALRAADDGVLRVTAALRHLLVDEYQDVNPAQEALIVELHRRSETLFVVGDDDQAIYGWRGADVNNILTFEQRYPGCSRHTLSLNYRSTPAIVQAADGLAAAELGASRLHKNPEAFPPRTPRDFRRLWFPDRQAEADWVADRIQALLGTAYTERNDQVRGLTPADFAILMRSTRQPEQDGTPRHAPFTTALAARGIPYSLEQGGGVFDRPEVRCLKDTFELLRSGSPNREVAQRHFDQRILACFPQADFPTFVRVLTDWGRRIHAPRGGARQRLYPQQLVHDLLNAFGLQRTNFDPGVMQDLGVLSRVMQDVETVYVSVDSASRFEEILNFLSNVAETGYDSGTQDILQRPDAVTVSTVHRVKGLEFPVVFVVDAENRRFPRDRSGYEGWLPPPVIRPALARGAYQGTQEEEARLFYTAVTRAERFLYVSGAANLPGGKRPRAPSRFAQRLQHVELSEARDGLPDGLYQAQPARRIDEDIVPTSYSDIRYYLRCPMDYRFRMRFGFRPAVPDLFGFGHTVHAGIGKLHEVYRERAPTGEEAERIARSVFHIKHVPPSQDPIGRPGAYERARDSAVRILRTYAETYQTDFTRRRQVEARFEILVEPALISGSIDLLLEEDEAGNVRDATVVDFKAIEGGPEGPESTKLEWTELALQVQLYARAAREVLGENARLGAVHLLKDNQRIEVPIGDEAVHAAIANVQWAVSRVVDDDFPMRPSAKKCTACDFQMLCPKTPQQFQTLDLPPEIHIPGRPGRSMARAFSEFEA